jgi:flagellar M-ring protein FliF
MIPLRQLTTKLTPKGWAVVGGSALIGVVFIYMLFSFASKPSYTTLLAGVDPAQTGKITSQLSTQGIPYEIQNNGTAVAVEADKTAQARIALATAGLLNSTSQPGFSLFDNQSLGQSTFQQQVTYQRALEGQLATTIESIQGVSSAQVQLVLPNPQDQLFSSSGAKSSAAVLLSGTTALDPSSVRGIAQLVASSVQGLNTSNVTITDGTGQLLWPTAAGGYGGGAALAKQADQAQYDSQMSAQVAAMLTQTLGPGKAEVQVNADLNANQSTTDNITYAKKGVALTSHTEVETLKGNGAGGTAAGTATNIGAGTVAGTGTTGTTSNYNHKITDINFGVDKTITHSVIAAGNVNRQSVSVIVDKSVPPSEIPALRAAVAQAVGLQTTRGDTLSFGQVAFAKPTVAAPTTPSKMIGYAKYALTGFGALIFLLFVGRLLRRRENESFAGQPTWLRELETPRPLAALEGGGGATMVASDEATRVMQLRSPINVAKKQVEDLVEREPDRVAAQVRAWMAED